MPWILVAAIGFVGACVGLLLTCLIVYILATVATKAVLNELNRRNED